MEWTPRPSMNYPLLFSFDGLIIGNGFAAEVSMQGRLLATLNQDGFWLYGVNPGALAVEGRTLDEAHANFRERLKLVFSDMAEAAGGSVGTFRGEVTAFFNACDEETEHEWDAAVDAVRANDMSLGDLPRRPADSHRFVTVTEKGQRDLRTSDNFPTSSAELALPCAA